MRTPWLVLAGALLAGRAFAAPYALEGSLREPVGDALVADGATLLAVTPNGVRRIDPGTRAVLADYPIPGAPIYSQALAVRGGEIVVGLPGWTVFADDSHGVVHVVDPATSSIRLSLVSPAFPQNDAFGISVAVAGDDLLVGASGEQRAYLFDGDSGALLRTFEDPTLPEPFTTGFGWAVAAVNGSVWIGAPTAGAVHRFDAASGAFLGSIPGEAGFGHVLRAAGDGVLIGGPWSVTLHDGATGDVVRTFDTSMSFGAALDTDGTLLAVGDPGFGPGSPEWAPRVGVAHVFDLATGALLATLPNPTPAEDTYEDEAFGRAIALAGSRVAVADPADYRPSGEFGGLYVFEDVAGCGDGILAGNETCDDGNATSGDGCDANCRASACGNGLVAGDEVCDDGNTAGGDGCDQNCRPTACGNGAVAGAEECDDGNLDAGDGCSPRCRLEFCGNGILDPGETCDDTDETAGDGCAECRLEVRDAFTCYRVRGTRHRPQRLAVTDDAGSRTVTVARPVMTCLGDALTAPGVVLTCYRVRAPRAARGTRRTEALDGPLGAATVTTGGSRTLCLPSNGARIVRHRHTLTDPTPNPIVDGGFGFAAAIAGGRVVVSEPGAPTPFQGSQHRFDGETGAFLGATTAPWGSRYLGSDVTDAGSGEVVVASMDDDARLLNVTTGAFVRTYTAPGNRTGDDRRQIVAAGPYVLFGDPNNHLVGPWAGAVQIFLRSTGALLGPFTDPQRMWFSTGFGRSLAALGTDVLVGDDARVRRFDPATWTSLGEYPAAPGSPSALAAAGDRVLIGTDVWSEHGGRAVLFDAATAAEIRSLRDPLGGARDLFGAAATSAGGAFVVAAPRAGWLLPGAGAVHVFDAASGERLHTILSPDPARGEGFGRSVAAGGDLLVATRLGDGAVSQGEAYVFTRRPLDAYACHVARGPDAPSAAPALYAADRFRAGSAPLAKLVSVCRPVAPGDGVVNDSTLLLACYESPDDAPAPRSLAVADALGTRTLEVRGRRRVCVPATATPPPS